MNAETSHATEFDAYIHRIYEGDKSRVAIKIIDYKCIHSESDITEWAMNAFDVSDEFKVWASKKANGRPIETIFYCMSKSVKQNMVILELNHKNMPRNIQGYIKEFRQMVSFHFYRDYRWRIDFVKG